MCSVSSGAGRFVLNQGEGSLLMPLDYMKQKPYQIEQAIVYCVNVDPKLMGA